MARFQRGQSGNPGGRPQGMAAYVRAQCGKDGQKLIAVLLEIALSEKAHHKDRIRAASELLDRGWNKPIQGMYFTDEMRPLVIERVTDADLSRHREAAKDR